MLQGEDLIQKGKNSIWRPDHHPKEIVPLSLLCSTGDDLVPRDSLAMSGDFSDCHKWVSVGGGQRCRLTSCNAQDSAPQLKMSVALRRRPCCKHAPKCEMCTGICWPIHGPTVWEMQDLPK